MLETWDKIKEILLKSAEQYPDIYKKRIKFEINEVEKQGFQTYWINAYEKKNKYASNPNKLLIPFYLNMVDVDPLNGDNTILCSTKVKVVRAHIEKYGSVPSYIIKDPDMPDIDIDCLPEARDSIKEYAAQKYGQNKVCSVGTYTTYKFKSALIDVAVSLGTVRDRYEMEKFTTALPLDVDDLKDEGKSACKGKIINAHTNEESECGFKHRLLKCPKCESTDTDGPNIAKLLEEVAALKEYYEKPSNGYKYTNKDVVEYSLGLIGRIRNMGMHSGALIITDRDLFGNIPLAKSTSKGLWYSMWSEGRNTQLSKWGYVKWDLLGLKTQGFIKYCCDLIKKNRGISFGNLLEGWEYIKPLERIAGYYEINGQKHFISLDDPHALSLAHQQLTDGIFQFDTDLAKSILQNGVKRFEDLLFYNAAGHPGPMASIPEAVENRDDKRQQWKQKLKSIHPVLAEILDDTYGIILWQEQLAAIWQRLGGFTSPEAQEARKAVAKKHTHKLKDIGKKWIKGATPNIGKTEAENLWQSMVSFGRYAFNKSHGVSYCLVAYRCLWLKAHFAPEWWAAVMSGCHPDKLERYMSVARSESWVPTDITYSGSYAPDKPARGVRFDTVNVCDLSKSFTVVGDVVTQGLVGIKGLGDAACEIYSGSYDYKSIEEFINGPNNSYEKPRTNKIFMERLIKLGAFKHLPGHSNAKALWVWYQFHHVVGKEYTVLRQEMRAKLLADQGWNSLRVKQETTRLISQYKELYPNKKKIPSKIQNFKPEPDTSLAAINRVVTDDFTLSEKLVFQKEYLGYYVDNPLDNFETGDGYNIKVAKQKILSGLYRSVKISVIVNDITEAMTQKDKPYAKLVISDGMSRSMLLMWNSELALNQDIEKGQAYKVNVEYDESRGIFTVAKGAVFIRLNKKQ